MNDRTPPLEGQRLASVDFDEAGDDYSRVADVVDDIEQANVMTSMVELDFAVEQVTGQVHKVVLDIDLPAQLLPSTTEGHYHLIIDKAMSWVAYGRLLDALAEAGVIEAGYRDASRARGYTCVRLPWVKKEARE
jgi:hypothetical protein